MVQYTTASSVQSELQTTTSFSGTTVPSLNDITSWIGEESSEIDMISGRVYASTSRSDVIDYNGENRIQTKYAPVISIARVLYTTADIGSTGYGLTNTATENTQYVSFLDRGEIEPLKWSALRTGLKTVQIDYTSGYTDIPDFITKLATKKVTMRVLNTLLGKDMKEGNSGGSISVGSINIVEPAEFGTARFKQLQTDVDMLQAKVIGKDNMGVYRYINY